MGAQAKGVHHSVICLFPVAVVPCCKHTGRLGPFRNAHILLACCICDIKGITNQFLRYRCMQSILLCRKFVGRGSL